MHPHRPKLSNVVADEIREGIRQGRWLEWLPQERLLAEELMASRSVIRQALALLKHEGVIESFQSKGNSIVGVGKRTVPKPGKLRTIALLTPGSIVDERPLVTLPMDDFREQLIKEGIKIQIVESKACYKKNPERALSTLMEHYSPDCWVLRLSTKEIQDWFEKRGLPAVILGTCHEGVNLPFIDIDRRALASHAVGVIIKAGHRKFSLLINKDSRGGDLETERGFREAVASAQKNHPDLVGTIQHHDESVEGVAAQVGRLLDQQPRPTALFIAQPAYYLTVLSDLARRGVKVPREMSLITQVGGSYLAYMLPRPASYHVNSHRFTRKLLALVLATMHHDPVARANVIIPTYIPGPSLGTVGKRS